MSAIIDRELIELAAAAYGLEHVIVYDACPEDGFLTAYAKIGKGKYWNPLADDGDALRLAVKLGIVVFPSVGEDDADAQKSTRRAIVRAAAVIGAALRLT